jgi:RNA polymerase sigma-70 factor (ECF subfamily)
MSGFEFRTLLRRKGLPPSTPRCPIEEQAFAPSPSPDFTTPAMTIPWEEHETEELAQLQTQGRAAVAELFARYEDTLRRMIYVRLDKRLYGRVDPADVLQESYMEAARRVDQFVADPAVPLFVWLRQLTIQVLIDLHRRHLGAKMRDARQEISLNGGAHDPLGTSHSLAAHLVADWTSPSQAAIREETLAELRAALETMDPIDREILALRHFEELGNNEVAAILGLQKSAASNRYVRALRRLKQILSSISQKQTEPSNEDAISS